MATAATRVNLPCTCKFRSVLKTSQRPVRKLRAVCASNAREDFSSRRSVLLTGSTILLPAVWPQLASAEDEKRFLPKEALSSFQRQDQRLELLNRAEATLAKYLTAEDAPAAVRLVLNDAATYNSATGTGGMNGSVVTDEELSRPENAGLEPVLAKLKKAKAEIDEAGKTKGGPISWADLLVLAGKYTTLASWVAIKSSKAADAAGGTLISTAFAADWPVQLGRVDSAAPSDAGVIPAPGAPVDTIKEFMAGLGAKPGQGTGGFFSPKPPFWERPAFVVWTAAALDPAKEEERLAEGDPVFAEYKKKYDQSRATVTRTDYEVDFITYYSRLTSLGAKFDPDAYLFDLELPKLRL